MHACTGIALDEAFGRGCFKNELIWHYPRWPGKKKPEDELVADFFCRSGTTTAVAEKLGRYERQAYLDVNFSLDRHSRPRSESGAGSSGNPDIVPANAGNQSYVLDARLRGHDGVVVTREERRRRMLTQKENEFREIIKVAKNMDVASVIPAHAEIMMGWAFTFQKSHLITI